MPVARKAPAHAQPPVVDRVHAVAPSVRCLEAVEAEYLGKLDVYVPKLSHLSMWYPRFHVLEERLREIKQRMGEDAFWLDPRQRPLELCRRVIWSFHEYTRDPRGLLDTRRAIAQEIQALQTEPRLILQTSPPEGTVVPAGPRAVNLRGLAPPGAKLTVNGETVMNTRPSGYFCRAIFLGDHQPTITVALEHDGHKTTATRTFKLAD